MKTKEATKDVLKVLKEKELEIKEFMENLKTNPYAEAITAYLLKTINEDGTPTIGSLAFIIGNMTREKELEEKESKEYLEYLTKKELSQEYITNTFSEYITDLTKYALLGLEHLKQLDENKKTKRKKKTKKTILKDTHYASVPVSLLGQDICKEYTTTDINRHENSIRATKEANYGVIEVKEYITTPFEFEKNQEEILRVYQNIKLRREALQIYFALISTYIENVPNKKYGKEIKLTFKQLHEDILKRSKIDRLRETDIKYYREIFSYLSTRRITWEPKGATEKPYKTKRLKNISVNDSNLILIETHTGEENEDKNTFTIKPTSYTLFELKHIKHISNVFPKDFITLDFKKNDNILYFGYYLTRIHKICINSKEHCKEFKFYTLIENALPNGKRLMEELSTAREKKKFFTRQILQPLKEALEILEDNSIVKKIDIPKEINLQQIKKIIEQDETQKIKIYYNLKTQENNVKAFK